MESGAITGSQLPKTGWDERPFGRLNGDNPWCVSNSGDETYRIDLIDLYWVTGVLVHARSRSLIDYKFKISRSLDSDDDITIDEFEDQQVTEVISQIT